MANRITSVKNANSFCISAAAFRILFYARKTPPCVLPLLLLLRGEHSMFRFQSTHTTLPIFLYFFSRFTYRWRLEFPWPRRKSRWDVSGRAVPCNHIRRGQARVWCTSCGYSYHRLKIEREKSPEVQFYSVVARRQMVGIKPEKNPGKNAPHSTSHSLSPALSCRPVIILLWRWKKRWTAQLEEN